MVKNALQPIAIAVVYLMAAPALASETELKDVRLEVTPLTNGADPYPHELVLLKIRGVYRPLINREKLIQPEMINFAWAELGRDKISVVQDGGFAKREFERIIAVYPDRPGKLEIGSFVHKLTVVDGDQQREIEVRSPPITLDVATWSGPGGPDDRRAWWLPARSLEVKDEWSGDPDHVPRGETLTRTVTLLADGVPADMLPPPPLMLSPGIISFRGPNDRETKIQAQGPIARATYSWEMRPTTAYPATVLEVRIPWFDTTTRTMREAIIPARRMAWAAAAGEAAEPPAPKLEKPSTVAIVGAGVAALVGGLAVLLLGGGGGVLRLPQRPPRELRALRSAARWRDASAFRSALTSLARREPARSAVWREAPDVRGGITALDQNLFAGEGSSPLPDLKALAKAVIVARRRTLVAKHATRNPLAPLDGPATRV